MNKEQLGTCMKQLGHLTSHLQRVLARSSITKARNRTTIPALLFIQNVPIQTKYERQMPKLFHARSLGVLFISSTLLLAAGCAGNKQVPVEEEKIAVVEEVEPAAIQAIPDIQQERVNLPPLESVTVYFNYDASEIKSTELGLIETHALYLMENPDQVLVLEGHADERGSDEYNKILGQSRAVAVRNVLLSQGISPRQIKIVSYGETQPEVLGNYEEAWSSNRRVAFAYELTDKQQAALNFSAPQTFVLGD